MAGPLGRECNFGQGNSFFFFPLVSGVQNKGQGTSCPEYISWAKDSDISGELALFGVD